MRDKESEWHKSSTTVFIGTAEQYRDRNEINFSLTLDQFTGKIKEYWCQMNGRKSLTDVTQVTLRHLADDCDRERDIPDSTTLGELMPKEKEKYLIAIVPVVCWG